MDRNKQQAPSNILKIDDTPTFQIRVANGQLEKPIARIPLKFDIGDHIFAGNFVVMKNLTGPIMGLHFMRQQCGHRHYIWLNPILTLDNASQKCIKRNKCYTPSCSHSRQNNSTAKHTKTIAAFVDQSTEWNTTGTVNLEEKFTEAASLIIFHSISTIIDRKPAVRVTTQRNHIIQSTGTHKLPASR